MRVSGFGPRAAWLKNLDMIRAMRSRDGDHRLARYSSESSEKKTAAGHNHVDLPPFQLAF